MHSLKRQQLFDIAATATRAFRQFASGPPTKLGDFGAGFHFDRRPTAAENSRASFAFQRDRADFRSDPSSFANADDRRFIFLEELQNALFLGFTHVSGIRIGIEIMRTDLKWDQP